MAGKSLLEKLLLKPGVTLAVVGAPPDQSPPAGAKVLARGAAEAVLLYARDRAALDGAWLVARRRLGEGGRLWVAYPKAGKLDTDLDRESVRQALIEHGFDAVRQIAIDATWSALWFKPVAS
jgi:hypothetical protein